MELERLTTVNLWENNFWEERRDLLFAELRENGFTPQNGVIMAFQEVRTEPFDSLAEIAKALEFGKDSIHYFPTSLGRRYGIGVISNLEVSREEFKFFHYDASDPLEFGWRGVGLVEFLSSSGSITLGVTHFSVSRKKQYDNAMECILKMKDFVIDGLENGKKEEYRKKKLGALCDATQLILAGDFNADPTVKAYRLFGDEGLTDITKSLHDKYGFSWPSDSEWFVDLHRRTWGEEPPFDVESQKRWMDYLFTCSLKPDETVLLGLRQQNGMYMSDHRAPAAFFNSKR